MKSDQELIQSWLDGNLSDAESGALELRLANEPALENTLHEQLQLKALELETAAQQVVHTLGQVAPPTFAASEKARRPRRMQVALAAGVLALAAGLVLAVQWRHSTLPPSAGDWSLAPTRTHAYRLALSEASAYRDYAVVRSETTASEPLRLQLLATLEEKAQWHALGVAQLLRGETSAARKTLAKASQSVEVLSDQAAAALADHDAIAALRMVSQCLSQSAKALPCVWNKALALESLGLLVGAREAFETVAAAGEPGWSEEALTRAKALKSMDLRETYLNGRKAAAEWVLGDVVPPETFAAKTPGLARLSAQVVLAAQGQAASVQAALEVLRNGEAPPSEAFLRAMQVKETRFTEGFRRLYLTMLPNEVKGFIDTHGVRVFSAEEKAQFVELVLARGTLYQQATVLLLGYDIVRHRERFERALKPHFDGWYDCGRVLQEGVAAFGQSQLEAAEQVLRRGLAACAASAYRLSQLEGTLGRVLLTAGRIDAAEALAKQALRRALALGQQDFVLYNLETLAEVARYQDDVAVAEGFFAELSLAQPQSCALRVRRHEAMASLLARRGSLALARAQMNQATCEAPSLIGISVLAELMRMAPEPGDAERFEASVSAYRKQYAQAAGDLLQADHYAAVARLSSHRSEALAQLKGLADLSGVAENDVLAAQTFSLSLTTLAVEAGRDQQWGRVLEAMAQLNRVALPARCAMAVERRFEAQVFAVSDANGVVSGSFSAAAAPTEDLKLDDVLARQLAPCARVVVLSGSEGHGRAGLLPNALAWFYAAPPTRNQAQPGGQSLVVRNVNAPEFLNLPALVAQSAAVEGGMVLEGAQATVKSVLARLPESNWIEFHTHGVVDAEVAEASHLVLSADGEQAYALKAEDISQLTLKHRPVVLLAACRSALATSIHRPNPWSLPATFVKAGARAVVAAAGDLPDRSTVEVFASLKRRIEAGEGVAEALRSERLARTNQASQQWVNQLVVFEEVKP